MAVNRKKANTYWIRTIRGLAVYALPTDKHTGTQTEKLLVQQPVSVSNKIGLGDQEKGPSYKK